MACSLTLNRWIKAVEISEKRIRVRKESVRRIQKNIRKKGYIQVELETKRKTDQAYHSIDKVYMQAEER